MHEGAGHSVSRLHAGQQAGDSTRGRKPCLQMVEDHVKARGEPSFVERLDAIDLQRSRIEFAAWMIYGGDRRHPRARTGCSKSPAGGSPRNVRRRCAAIAENGL